MKNNYSNKKIMSLFLLCCILLGSYLNHNNQALLATEEKIITSDAGKLFLDTERINQNNISEERKEINTLDNYGVPIFTGEHSKQYQLFLQQQEKERVDFNNQLFLSTITTDNSINSQIFKNVPFAATKEVNVNNQYFDISYIVYIAIGIFIFLAIIVFVWLMKKELNITQTRIENYESGGDIDE